MYNVFGLRDQDYCSSNMIIEGIKVIAVIAMTTRHRTDIHFFSIENRNTDCESRRSKVYVTIIGFGLRI